MLVLEATDHIERFVDFFDIYSKPELLEILRTGTKKIDVDFSLVSQFDLDLAEELLDNPEEVIKAGEKAIDIISGKTDSEVKVRLINLPKIQDIMVRDIRSEHIGKLLCMDGIIRQKSDVRPQVTVARFECPSCGNVTSIPQLDTTFKEQTRCGCGRKGKFRLIGKELVDAQSIVLEEAPEALEGGEQPKRINLFLKGDLVSPLSEKKTNPGSKIMVVGIVREVPIMHKVGLRSTRFDLFVDVNNIIPKEETYAEIKISDEEELQLREIAADPNLFERLVKSLAPSIYGHEKVKLALLLQMLSGVRKKREGGIVIRGDIHILLVGDPGAGKSQLLRRITAVAPKARYVAGKGASGAGLTAAVVKDEFIRGWALEAGALVLTNQGICMIDELDKMSNEDRSAMHEALEQQTVSIAKANIQATLRAETTVLAAANPKFGRFSLADPIAEQIDLQPTLLSRFDLIFAIKDIPNPDRDAEMAGFILDMHRKSSHESPDIDTSTMKKYIAYARRFTPKLTEGAFGEIKSYYVSMRGKGSEGESKSVPITPRQLEALVRLSEAAAKARFSNTVERQDSKLAIDLVEYYLMQFGMDTSTRTFDIDRIVTGVPASERSKINTIRHIITMLEERLGSKEIQINDIAAEAALHKIPQEQVHEILEKMIRTSDIYKPSSGKVARI